MELKTFDTRTLSDCGVAMAVRDPETRKPSDFVITLCGQDSERYQAAKARLSRRYQKEMKKGSDPTPEELENDSLDLLVACTLGWKGLTDDKQEVAFTPAKAREVYQAYPSVREQAAEFVSERANFLQR